MDPVMQNLFTIVGGEKPESADALARSFDEYGVAVSTVVKLIEAIKVGIVVLDDDRSAPTALQEIKIHPDYGICTGNDVSVMQLILLLPNLRPAILAGLIPDDECRGTLEALRDTLIEVRAKMSPSNSS